MCDSTLCSDERLSEKRTNLCKRIKLTLKYYEEADKSLRNKAVEEKPKNFHGADKFLNDVNTMYQENKDFCNDLLCCLMHSFVGKLNGNSNPQCETSVLN